MEVCKTESGDEESGLLVPSDEIKNQATFDDALRQAGHGRLQVFLLLACGSANAANAIVVSYIAYVIPSLTDQESFGLTGYQKGLLTGIAFAGLLIGDLFWGTMADATSRKHITILSLSLGIVFCFLTALAPSGEWMIAFRFFLGAGVGGSMAIIFAYLGDFLAEERRPPWIAALSLSWLVGALVAAGIAWLTIPNDHYEAFGSDVASWRIYIVICSFVAFAFSVPVWFIPRSPRLLFEKGQIDETKRILSLVKRVNTHGFMELFAKRSDDIDLDVQTPAVKSASPSNFAAKLRHFGETFSLMGKQLRELFRPPWLRSSLVLNIVSFTFTFGYYGFTMWMPEYFDLIKKRNEPNCTIPGANCSNASTILDNIYFQAFISRTATVPAQIFSIWIIAKIGSKMLLVISLFLTAAFVYAFTLMSTKAYGPLLMSCLIGSVSNGGWSAIDVLSVELFPTLLRSSAVGMQEGVGRIGALIGNLTFGALSATHMIIPLFISAALLLVGAVVSCLGLRKNSAAEHED